MKIFNRKVISKQPNTNSNKSFFHNKLEKTPERDIFMQNSNEKNPVCPSSVAQTTEDNEGMKVVVRYPYACDIEKMKDLTKEEQREITQKLISEGRCYNPAEEVDIYSQGTFEQTTLSNFDETDITFDGIQINSIEGFLQSLKTNDTEKQKEICKLSGKEAKSAGRQIEGFNGNTLYWKGKKIDRNSDEYKNLLKEVYKARLEQDSNFKRALKRSKNKKLVHTIGLKDPQKTILTEEEFIGILYELRQNI